LQSNIIGIIGPYKSEKGLGIGGYVLKYCLTYCKGATIHLLSRNKNNIDLVLNVHQALIEQNEIQVFSYDIGQENNFFSIFFDYLFILSPSSTHLKYLEKAVYQSKTIICEKPISNYPINKKSISNLACIIKKHNNIILLTQRNMLFNFIDIESISNATSIQLNFTKKNDLSKICFLENYLAHGLALLFNIDNSFKLKSYTFKSNINKQTLKSNIEINQKIIYLEINSKFNQKYNQIILKTNNQKTIFNCIVDNIHNRTELNRNGETYIFEDLLINFLNQVFNDNKQFMITTKSILSLMMVEKQFFE